MSLIIILGPTAVGKTKLAVQLASQIGGEVISADSRQVYRGMDIGTGKDLKDFSFNGKRISHHLIDIKEAGEEYNLFDFQQDFYSAYLNIINRAKRPILCGGSGLYLEAAIAKNQLVKVPENIKLRQELSSLTNEQLVERLLSLNVDQHNTSDLKDRGRCIRAIEIECFKKSNEYKVLNSPVSDKQIFGIQMERSQLRNQIELRLKDRLKEGMIEEVEALVKNGVTFEKLAYYGLEYRFISMYLNGEIVYEEMYEKLLQAIRRFAKKQMTWYRRMEKNGNIIHWIDANLSIEDKLIQIQERIGI